MTQRPVAGTTTEPDETDGVDEVGDELAGRVWETMRSLVIDRPGTKNRVAEELGVSFSRARALPRLIDGPLTMRELAKALSTDAPYTTLIVDDLEREGWVLRQIHPDDRRSKLVVLTPTGRRAARRARQIMSTPPAALTGLTPDELATLDRLLGGVLDRRG